jgi:hypothetical protein
MNTYRWPHLVCMAAAIGAAAQPPAMAQRATETNKAGAHQASFERTAAVQSEIVFGRSAPRIGDEVEQSILLETRMTTLVRQQSKIIDMKKSSNRSQQRRVVTTTELDAGRAIAVAVHYHEATSQHESSEDSAVSKPPSPNAEPVQGKMYYCRREPGEDGKLVITDENGSTPPAEELGIVSQNMEMVGRRNPLAEFLAGRSVAIGEKIALPKEVANRLFNLGESFGEVQRFELMLQRTSLDDGVPCATFQARVEAASNDSSQMRMEVEGPLVVQIGSCRATSMRLAGPIAISEVRGSYSNIRQFIGTGQLNMTIASTYRDAAR